MSSSRGGTWQTLGERASDAYRRAGRNLITPLLGLRYRRWRVARAIARLSRWLRSDWRPLVIGIAALVGALVAGSRIRVDGHGAQAVVAATAGHPAVAAHPASAGRPIATAPQVLIVFALLAFLRLAWEVRQRTVFQDIVDGTGTYPGGVVPGLSAMMAAEVSRLANLYRSLDAQLNFSRDNQSLQDPLRATLQVDDTAQYLETAVSQSSTVSLGPVTIPVGTVLSLLARLMKGPRVSGNLQWDGDHLLLVVRYDGKPPRVWKVTGDVTANGVTAGAGPASGPPATAALGPKALSLGRMVEELGCRMFADLALRGEVRHQAAAAFTRAMQIYVEEGRRGKGDPARLHEVANALLDAVAADQNFELASYNLGVVYGEMGMFETARQILAEARDRNPDRWDVTYALALPRRQPPSSRDAAERPGSQRRLAVPEVERLPRQFLCDEVLRRRPGPGAEAQAYDLRGFLEAPSDGQRDEGKRLLTEAYGLVGQTRVVFDALLPHAANLDGTVDEARRRFAKATRANKALKLSQVGDALDQLRAALDQAAAGGAVNFEVLCRRAHVLAVECRLTDGLLAENRQARKDALREAGRSQRLAARRAWKALRRAERAARPTDFDDDRNDTPALRRHRVLASTCLVHLAVTFLDSTELDHHEERRDKGRRRRAEVVLHQAVRLDPPDPDAHYRLGRVWTRSRHKAAKRLADLELGKAVALRPSDPGYWARFLQSRVQSNDGAAVAAALTAYVEVSPPPFTGDELHTSHRRVVLEQLLSDAPVWDTLGATPWLGDDKTSGLSSTQQKQRRYDLAARLRAQSVLAGWLQAEAQRAEDGDAAAWVELWQQLTLTEWDADRGWEHAASAWALKRAYNQYLLTNEFEPGPEASILASELAKAVDHVHRTNPEVCRREGLLGDYAQWLHRCGRPEDAIVEAEKAWQADPLNPFGLTVVGDAYFIMQEYALADRAFQRAAQWINDRKEVWRITWSRATCLFNQADDQRDPAIREETLCTAIKQLEGAFDQLDDSEIEGRIVTHYWLGRLHAERRDYDQAIPHLRTASSYRGRGGDPFAYASSRIVALLILADTRGANHLYEEAMATYEEVERSIGELATADFDRLVGGELQDDIILGDALIFALAGRAEHLARRRADLPAATELLGRARQISQDLQNQSRRPAHARLDAIAGLIELAAGNAAVAESHLQRAIDQADDARVYIDLVELWARQIDETDSRHSRELAHRINDLIRHVDEIDFRDEWTATLMPFRSVVDRVLGGH